MMTFEAKPLLHNEAAVPGYGSYHPHQWTREEVRGWLVWCVQEYGLDLDIPNKFPMNGKGLCMLSKEDFRKRAPDVGDVIYNSLMQRQFCERFENNQTKNFYQDSKIEINRAQFANGGVAMLQDTSRFGNGSGAAILQDTSRFQNSNFGITLQTADALFDKNAVEDRYDRPLTPDRMADNSEPLNLTVSSLKIGKSPASPFSTPPSPTPTPPRNISWLLPALSWAPPTQQLNSLCDIVRHDQTSLHPQLPVLNGIPDWHSKSFQETNYFSKSDCSSPSTDLEQQQHRLMNAPTTTTNFDFSECMYQCHTSRMSTSDRLLWKFLAELLNSSSTRCVLWEDKESLVFRIADPEELAQLWGVEKCKKGMTYEKLSRALRYYYKMNIITKVPGKRLTYQFMRAPHLIKQGKRGAKPGLPHKRKNRKLPEQETFKVEDEVSEDELTTISVD